MKSTTRRKLGASGMRALGFGSAVLAPAAVVLQKFPLWGENRVTDAKTLGVGGVMAVIIVLIGCRQRIWPVIKERLHVTSVAAIILWGLAFGLILGIERIIPMLPDLRTICLTGLIGTGAGQALDTAAGFLDPDTKKKEEVEEA